MLTLWLALAARRNCWREICFFLSNHCVPSRSDLVGTRLAPTLLVFSLDLGGGDLLSQSDVHCLVFYNR